MSEGSEISIHESDLSRILDEIGGVREAIKELTAAVLTAKHLEMELPVLTESKNINFDVLMGVFNKYKQKVGLE